MEKAAYKIIGSRGKSCKSEKKYINKIIIIKTETKILHILVVAESNFMSDLRGYFLFPVTRPSAHVPLVSLIFRGITMQRNVASPACCPVVSRTSIVLCMFGHANRMRYYYHYYHHCVIITIIRIRNIIIVIFERERRRWQHAIAGARQGWGHRRIRCTEWFYFSIVKH